MNYIINSETLWLKKNNYVVEVGETKKLLTIDRSLYKIIDESCKYYGSSLKGRISATKYLTGIVSKVPIIISEKKNFLIFPIFSERNEQGLWFVYNNIVSYRRVNKYVEITFINNEKVIFLISFTIFHNQFLKSSRLLALCALRN